MDNLLVKNKKAYFNYEILEKYEAGISLVGTEVKSIKQKNINIGESFAFITKQFEIILKNLHISLYKFGNINNHDPGRDRKLLLHKKEILKISQKIKLQKLTLVPLSLYLKHGKVKVELGLAKGKRKYEKRETIKKKDDIRKLDRLIKNFNK